MQSAPEVVRLGTWNVSGWSAERWGPIASLDVQLLALQETKLASIPLERVREAAKRRGFTLHHGKASAVRRAVIHGNSCGVGILASGRCCLTVDASLCRMDQTSCNEPSTRS